MNKKILIVLAISVIFLFVFFFSSNISVENTPSLVNVPVIPVQIEGKLPLSLTVDPSEVSLSKELPLATLEFVNITREFAFSVANNLGFEGEPAEFTGKTDGLIYIWTNQEATLFITPKTATVEYRLNLVSPPVVQNKQLTNTVLSKEAENFLVSGGLVGEGRLKEFSVTPYKAEDVDVGLIKSDRKEADLFQANFTYIPLEEVLLSSVSYNPLVYVQILPDGSIYSSVITLVEKVSFSPESYPVKSFKEISESLDEAVLVNVFGDAVNLPDISIKDISSLEIDTISQIFLLDADRNKTLQPVFHLEGSVSIKNTVADRAELYLPALKNTNPEF